MGIFELGLALQGAKVLRFSRPAVTPVSRPFAGRKRLSRLWPPSKPEFVLVAGFVGQHNGQRVGSDEPCNPGAVTPVSRLGLYIGNRLNVWLPATEVARPYGSTVISLSTGWPSTFWSGR